MLLKDEKKQDIEQITRIQYAAFKDHPIHEIGAEPVEHRIVKRLRMADALTLSILADMEGESVGHIAISPAAIGESLHGWYLLGPVGVLPAHQRKGVGSALIDEAIRRMKTMDAKGIVLVGDPAFYKRFGFSNVPDITYEGIPGQFILSLPFTKERTKGGIIAHKAFYPED